MKKLVKGGGANLFKFCKVMPSSKPGFSCLTPRFKANFQDGKNK